MAVKLLDMYVDIQADGKKAAREASDDFQSVGEPGFARNGLNFGKRMVGGLALAVGGAAIAGVGTLAGVALTKGLDRALSIQDATAKLTGLGHSGESVRQIMDNALASVRGTAFGLGDAAGVAAGAVAAGIAPGEKLTRVLKLTADAATIAGVGMNEMGSIFNKVAASGKLQGDVIAQLQDAGVPVLQFVAKQMGVTASEAAKLASEGKVSFEIFSDAMEAGLGGAALSSGATARGAFANVGAALGRFGAMFTTPLVAAAPAFFSSLTSVIDSAAGAAKPFADRFALWVGPAMERTSEKIQGLTENAGKLKDGFTGLRDLIVNGDFTGALTKAFGWQEDGKMVDFILTVRDSFVAFSDAISPLWAKLEPLGGTFADLWADISPLALVFQALLPYLPQVATQLGSLAAAVGGELVDALSELLPSLVDLAKEVLPELVPAFAEVVRALLPLIPAITPLITTLIPPLVDLLVALLEPTGDTSGIDNVTGAISGLAAALVWALGVIDTSLGGWTEIIDLLDGSTTPIESFKKAISGDFGPIVQVAVAGLSGLSRGLGEFARSAVAWAQQLPGEVVAWLQQLPAQIFTFFSTAVSWLVQAGTNILLGLFLGLVYGATFAINYLAGLPAKLIIFFGNALGWLQTAGLNILIGLYNGLVAALPIVTGFVASIPGRVINLLAGAAGWLVGAGRNATGGLANGAQSGFGAVLGFVGSIPGRIVGALGNVGGILVSAGAQVVNGFVSGMASGIQRVAQKAAEVANAARIAAERALGIASPSRVFRDKVGKMVGAGFIVGVEAMAPKMQVAMATAVTPGASVSRAVDRGYATAPSLQAQAAAPSVTNYYTTVPVTAADNPTLYGNRTARAIVDGLI